MINIFDDVCMLESVDKPFLLTDGLCWDCLVHMICDWIPILTPA